MSNAAVAPMKKKLIGQTVFVKHRSVQNKAGVAEIKAVVNREACVNTINAVYMDGRIRTNTGDLWDVKPSRDGKYDWETSAVSEA